jgi:hypothetical protein
VVRESCRHEWALHLDDVLLRRTSWHFYHPNQMETATLAARWMADELGWSREQMAQELQRYSQTAEFNPLATPGAGAQAGRKAFAPPSTDFGNPSISGTGLRSDSSRARWST